MAKRQRKRKNGENDNKKLFRMKYGGSRGVCVWFDENPRKGTCQVCGKSVHEDEIKFTNIHHFFYQWRPQTVKKDPKLALENCIEVCYYDHNWLDALRVILSVDGERFMQGVEKLPDKSKKELKELCERYLNS